MRRFLVILLFISIGVNAYFLIINLERKHKSDEQKTLHFWKDITHKEGYKFFENKMKTDFPETDLKQKTCLVYFWDSTSYGFQHADAMRGLDSLAATLGRYTFNYIFATEMEETAAKNFLERNGAKFKYFKVLGGMDDFMSGVYTEKPVKWKHLGPKPDSTKINSDCPDMTKMKVKGYYFLMDNKGVIIYHNYKCFMPQKDTSLMRRLNSFTTVKNLKSLD